MTNIAEKLTAVAENQQKLFDAGKKAEYDAFWDAYQQNGERKSYTNAFAGTGWNQNTFFPRHSIQVVEGYMIFRMHNQGYVSYDLVEHLSQQGITLDFSTATNIQYAFASANLSRIGVINCSSLQSLANAFSSSYIVTIDRLISHEGLRFDSAFHLAEKLKNITFEGVIDVNLDMHWSPLTKASIQSVFACLSPSITGQTLSLSQAAVDTAFETSDGARDGASSPAWETLIATKSNWTISLM
ncbi:MAG: hypothetical protein IKW60_01695 [Clostridia bacterium]|nr:hypothetical protein [Clostridia bacterium]